MDDQLDLGGLEPMPHPEAEFAGCPIPEMATAGDIAGALGLTTRQVSYEARARDIEPSERIGNLNLYFRGRQADILSWLQNPRYGHRGPSRSLSREACKLIRDFQKCYDRWDKRLDAERTVLVIAGLRTELP